MDSQTSNSDPGCEARGGSADPAQHPMPPGQVKKAVDGASQVMERERLASRPSPKNERSAEARALQAYVDRRKKLAERIKAEHPSYTQDEIEARLEQFGT
jgi:hypothetical protein